MFIFLKFQRLSRHAVAKFLYKAHCSGFNTTVTKNNAITVIIAYDNSSQCNNNGNTTMAMSTIRSSEMTKTKKMCVCTKREAATICRVEICICQFVFDVVVVVTKVEQCDISRDNADCHRLHSHYDDVAWLREHICCMKILLTYKYLRS